MNIIIITTVVFLIAFTGLAIGAIIAGKPVKGSCGGIGAMFGSSACDMCSLKDKCQSTGKELCEEGEDCETPC
ncbi:MAG: Na(+)-translocating NADH-quinone reductase subunit E [Halobacteriovoraceae bacterium]|nr:Na(+)-translocating NADH-quinone reductase subunit E [Halobacteriovoraceae bacterium]|tara:strand:+ start:4804 stop:5022 length:219 start_codon:yes stop_codon:yes gene_type:complete